MKRRRSPGRVSSPELGSSIRRGRDRDESERTKTPLIDFCNRREGRAHPGAARHPARRRVERRAVAIRRPRAAEHRLPGWESSSRSADRPDPTKLRHEAREACSERGGYPCRTRKRPKNPERLRLASCPEVRLRPAARTVRPSNEPEYLHVTGNRDSSPRPFRRLQRSRTKASIFHAPERCSPRRSTPASARPTSRFGSSACDRNDLSAAS
jgi:hypothetical protein